MAQSYRILGMGRPLVDGRDKAAGTVRYVADMDLPGLLHGQPVLSLHAHAEIVSIDKSEAEAVPGVVAVLTAEDLPGRDRLTTSRTRLMLARGKVLFVGQPLAVVVAKTRAAAADAADLVSVEYEPLPAAVHLRDAIRPQAPALWPERSGGIENRNNVSAESHFRRGDVEKGFAESDVIVEQTYETSNVHQGYVEPQGCVAVPDPLGHGVTIYASTQGKYLVRDRVARMLRLPPRQVRIVALAVGGSFGAKYGVWDPLTAAVAMAVARPVRIVLTRSADFLSSTPAPATIFELKTGARRDGTVAALQARVWVDNGSFDFEGFKHGDVAIRVLDGYYDIPHVQIDSYEVNTNKPPIGSYRAPGAPQPTFALESNIDDMAAALGMDPLELRMRNVSDGEEADAGRSAPRLELKKCLESLRAHPAWRNRATQAGEGVGIALGGKMNMVGTAEATCRVDSDGTVGMELGHVDVTGNDSAFVLIVAEILGVSPDDVVVAHGDTTAGTYAPMSAGSQVTYSVAGAVEEAARSAGAQLAQLAAEQLEAAPEDIVLADGQAYVTGVPGKTITVAELARIARSTPGGTGPILGQGCSAIGQGVPAAAAHLVKVKVDPETGRVLPMQYVLAQDVGFALNPMLVEGQLHGGMVQGLGMALHEGMIYDGTGQLLSASLLDYSLPRADDVPALETILVENPSPEGPFGLRGVAECPIIGGAAAVANAVKDCVGIRVTRLPIRSESLWRAMRSRRHSQRDDADRKRPPILKEGLEDPKENEK